MFIIILMVVLQILIESLPISSSTHLLLFKKMVSFNYPIDHNLFNFLMHVPTVLIIVYFFYRRDRRFWWQSIFYLMISTTITVLLYPLMQALGLYWPLIAGLLVTSIGLFSTKYHYPPQTSLNIRSSIVLGMLQAVALLPGISRLALTCAGGLWCGLARREAFYYACALQLPLYSAAGSYGLAKVMWEQDLSSLFAQIPVITLPIIGSAMIVSYWLLCFTYWLMLTNRLWYLSFYSAFLICLLLFSCI